MVSGRLELTASGLDRAAFEEAWARLEAAGYRLAPREEAWQAFEAARSEYAGRLDAMAAYWVTPTNSWLEPDATLRSPVHPDDESEAEAGPTT